MKHEDFKSLDIAEILSTVLGFAKEETKCEAVHWLSSFGLSRIYDSHPNEWQWVLASADIVEKHMISLPKEKTLDQFPLWETVSQLYPRPWKRKFGPHMLSDPNRFVYPVVYLEKLLGMLVLEKPQDQNPVTLVRTLKVPMELAARYLHFGYQHLEARNLSFEDELTGLYNQRYLPMVLEHEIQRSGRQKKPFCLLFLDIDYFKMVNDGRGHWVGSRLLVEIGKVLKSQVRACDYTFRYGGDEFIVLLGGANLENSKGAAERIRKAIEQRTFVVEGHTFNLTVSIGLAAYPDHAQTAAGLIQIADQAMYYGKRKSRNIVFVAS